MAVLFDEVGVFGVNDDEQLVVLQVGFMLQQEDDKIFPKPRIEKMKG